MSQTHVEAHAELIAQHEQEFLARRTPGERFGDGIASWVGSFPFVRLHSCVFKLWITWNYLASAARQFDPYPFSLIGTMLAMEGILLASFILMRQSRLARLADERNHLMLLHGHTLLDLCAADLRTHRHHANAIRQFNLAERCQFYLEAPRPVRAQ